MKRFTKETTILGKRGPQKVITYGYNTQVDGLDVVRVVGHDKEFCIVQSISGLSVGVYFTSATKSFKFANKYLKNFDWNRNIKEIQADRDLYKCIESARNKEGL